MPTQVRPFEEDAATTSVRKGEFDPLKGETAAQMTHARALKALGTDTSVDQPWEVNSRLAIIDVYLLVTTGVWLLLRIVVFILPTMLVSLLLLLPVRIKLSSLPAPCETVERRCGCLEVLFIVPMGVMYAGLAAIGLALDYIMFYVFGLLFMPVRVCVTGCPKWSASMRALAPYRGGPSVWTHPGDMFVALVGQCNRHGVLETVVKTAIMPILLPWLKYYINANPLLYDLEERFVQQISTSLQDVTLKESSETGRLLISRAKLDDALTKAVDRWAFVPHYPYPPPGRDWALGLQAAGGMSFKPNFYMVTHTTHALAFGTLECRSSDYLVLSNSVAAPVYRVMLWYNNPYHFCTGYVEASLSTGLPSQPEKRHGGEHPMWLITARSPLFAYRHSVVPSPSWIDRFFDWWLPFFVYEMRKITRGKAAADELREAVVSKDGISRPSGKVNVPKVEELP